MSSGGWHEEGGGGAATWEREGAGRRGFVRGCTCSVFFLRGSTKACVKLEIISAWQPRYAAPQP